MWGKKVGIFKKRGRPKINRVAADIARLELQRQKLLNREKDPLDVLLEKAIITETQYYLVIKLRRVFNAQYGYLRVRAYNPVTVRGKIIPKEKDEALEAAQEAEYNFVMRKLAAHGYLNIISKVCIYGEMPQFLSHQAQKSMQKNMIDQENLDFLAEAVCYLQKIYENYIHHHDKSSQVFF